MSISPITSLYLHQELAHERIRTLHREAAEERLAKPDQERAEGTAGRPSARPGG